MLNLDKALEQLLRANMGLLGVDSGDSPIEEAISTAKTKIDNNEVNTSVNIGNVNYTPTTTVPTLAEVDDPEQLFADVAQQRDEFVRSYVRPFQDALIEQLDSTALVDQAPEDAARQSDIQEGVARRNLSRYGVQETAATRNARNTSNQLTRNLAEADAVNNARLQQRTQNQNLLGQLVNLSLGADKTALGMLGQASSLQGARESAYTSAQASAKAQRYGFVGSLFSMI